MTPQEISDFVTQPIPRRVPYKIFCDVTYELDRWWLYCTFISIFLVLYLGHIVFACFLYIVAMLLFPNIRKTRRILKRGLFTTGHIQRKSSSPSSLFSSIATKINSFFSRNSAHNYIVSFVDQCGEEREANILFPAMFSDYRHNMPSIRDLASYGNPVSLLYVPNMSEVLVADLWRDYSRAPLSLAEIMKPKI